MLQLPSRITSRSADGVASTTKSTEFQVILTVGHRSSLVLTLLAGREREGRQVCTHCREAPHGLVKKKILNSFSSANYFDFGFESNRAVLGEPNGSAGD